MKIAFPMAFVAIFLTALSGCSSQPVYTGASGKCDEVNQYDIAFTRFDETAQQLAHATGCFVETSLSETGSVTVKPVHGEMSIREALRTAIKGSELEISREGPDRIAVTKTSR